MPAVDYFFVKTNPLPGVMHATSCDSPYFTRCIFIYVVNIHGKVYIPRTIQTLFGGNACTRVMLTLQNNNVHNVTCAGYYINTVQVSIGVYKMLLHRVLVNTISF